MQAHLERERSDSCRFGSKFPSHSYSKHWNMCCRFTSSILFVVLVESSTFFTTTVMLWLPLHHVLGSRIRLSGRQLPRIRLPLYPTVRPGKRYDSANTTCLHKQQQLDIKLIYRGLYADVVRAFRMTEGNKLNWIKRYYRSSRLESWSVHRLSDWGWSLFTSVPRDNASN